MKLSCAAQSREARNQNKNKIGGPGEVHFIPTTALIIQVKKESVCLSFVSCLWAIMVIFGM